MKQVAEITESCSGPRAIWLTSIAALPTLGCVALVFLVAVAWQHFRPVSISPSDARLDDAIVLTQRERAKTIPAEVDVLMIGDSSGMMGIDAPRLTELLRGANVESLNTVGLVPPKGNAAILQRFSERPGRARRLLITLHPNSLKPLPFRSTWARIAIYGARPRIPRTDVMSAIGAPFVAVGDAVLSLPMDGPLGRYYGTPAGFADFLRSHQGTAIDPRRLRANQKEFAFINRTPCFLDEKWLAEFTPLARAVGQLGRNRARFVLMPVIAGRNRSEAVRNCRETARKIQEALRLDPARQLVLPAVLPHYLFANITHLNSKGRALFTGALASELERDLATYP